MISPQEMLDVHRKRRAVRKFHEEQEIPRQILERIVEAGRYAPFSCNAQAVDYVVISSTGAREIVSPLVTFAHHVEDMDPKADERPTAYILPLMNSKILVPIIDKFVEEKGKEYGLRAQRSFDVSYGMVLQAMISQSLVEGVSSCPMAGIKEKEIKDLFDIDPKYDIPTALALGYAHEDKKSEARVVQQGESTKYFVENSKLIVPKLLPRVKFL